MHAIVRLGLRNSKEMLASEAVRRAPDVRSVAMSYSNVVGTGLKLKGIGEVRMHREEGLFSVCTVFCKFYDFWGSLNFTSSF